MTLKASPKLRRHTDNRSIADKVLLRSMVIKKAQLEPVRVLDLFAGEGNIWNEMRRKNNSAHVAVESYTPIDRVARQPGQIRFKITPRLFEALDLSRFNVVDVDTYGDPFSIWHEILFHITCPTAVFLTRGRVTYGAGKMPITQHAKRVMGMPVEWDVPGKIELLNYADRCCLLEECPTAQISFGFRIELRRVDYYGLFVEPGRINYLGVER